MRADGQRRGGYVIVSAVAWGSVPEGEASIFKPAGGGKYAPIARVQIGLWATAKK